MKKIDIKKLEQIKKQHFEYCKKLKPDRRRPVSDDLCWKLCCENPFDFDNLNPTNPDLKYLKQDYWQYVMSENNISYISQYGNFRTETEKNKDWNGVKLLRHLGINVCPYCGLNYISSVDKQNGEIITIATFDHYFPKEQYRFLAMNIYNLIPACKNCNTTFKHDDNNKVINPYFNSVEENITFRIANLSIVEQMLFSGIEPELEVLYDPTKEIVFNHCNVLAIQERYNNFKNIARTLIYKRQKYNKNYIAELKSLFNNFLRSDFERDLIKQDIFSTDETFSKFKSDIWEQLSINQKD